jgi:hypothetical protein
VKLSGWFHVNKNVLEVSFNSERSPFRALVLEAEPRYKFPSRAQVSSTLIPNMHQSAKTKLLEELRNIPYVAITTGKFPV